MTFSDFNWVDYLILGIFVFSTLSGLMRGLVKEIISLCTLVAAVIIASLFSNQLAAYFTSSSTMQTMVDQTSTTAAQPLSYVAIGLSFLLLFVATCFVGAIIGFILNLVLQRGIIGFGNRILGGLFGFIRGFILNLVFIFVVQLTAYGSSATWAESTLVDHFQPAVVWLAGMVSPNLSDLKEKLTKAVEDAKARAAEYQKAREGKSE